MLNLKLFGSVSLGEDICIDPGTDFTSVYISGGGVVLREPSCIAVNKNTGEIEAVGSEAADMEGREPKAVRTVRPIQGGVVTDSELAGKLLSGLLSKVKKHGVVKPRVMLTIPCGITDVEERAVIGAAMRAGARQVIVMEAPVAAALGAGCDVTIARGLMVLDIGAGKTDMAAISLCNTVVSRTAKIAGGSYTDDVQAFLKKKHSIKTGDRTARYIKENIASLTGEKSQIYEVSGMDIQTRLPRKVRISSSETENIFDVHTEAITAIIKETLDSVPPELLGDILEDGILLVGGGAKLNGLVNKLREKSGIKIFPADDIDMCVIKGAGIAMENLNVLPNIAQSYHNL